MKILQMVTLSQWGGAQRIALEYSKILAREGFEVSLGASPGGRLEKEAEKNGLEFIPLPFRREVSPLKDLSALNRLRSLVKKRGFTVLHSHSTKAGVISRLPVIPGIKIFTVHGWCFTPGTGREGCKILEKFLSRFTWKITCVSKYDLELGKRAGINAEKLYYLPNGIEDVNRLAEPEKSQLIVSVARFSRQKDHFTLLKALSAIEGARALLVGDGPLFQKVKEFSRKLGIEVRVEFPGEVKDIPGLLSRAGIFVLSSNWEGLPLSVLEAMRAALPVVATDVGGVREMVKDGESGFLVPKGDAKALEKRLKELLSSSDLRRSMGKGAREIYLERYNYRRMKEALLELYGKLPV